MVGLTLHGRAVREKVREADGPRDKPENSKGGSQVHCAGPSRCRLCTIAKLEEGRRRKVHSAQRGMPWRAARGGARENARLFHTHTHHRTHSHSHDGHGGAQRR